MPWFKGLVAIGIALFATPVLAEMNGTLRIGVLNDMSSGTIPADKAFRPLNGGGCPLVKAN